MRRSTILATGARAQTHACGSNTQPTADTASRRTYTDDISTASSTDSAESQTVNEIGHKFEITDHGRPSVVLGMGIVHHPNGDISIHQKSLIVKMLTEYNMMDCNPKYTPLPPDAQPHRLAAYAYIRSGQFLYEGQTLSRRLRIVQSRCKWNST